MLKMFVYYFTLNWKLNFQKYHNFFCPSKILHEHCFQFLVDFKFLPDAVIYIKIIAYAKLWREKRVLWYFLKMAWLNSVVQQV